MAATWRVASDRRVTRSFRMGEGWPTWPTPGYAPGLQRPLSLPPSHTQTIQSPLLILILQRRIAASRENGLYTQTLQPQERM